ncbi:MAG: GNAT family N-acetyltransferase [Deltaproteobacteria bacterium]|nr:GNAT family N-acetyltransferase [Deltaproteobacteria bacterium]
MAVALDLRRLSERDVCGGFLCGTPALDDFIRRYAKQQEKRRQSATTLAFMGGDIAGFASILPGAIEPGRLTTLIKGLPRQAVPVLTLARMATDQRFKGCRVGSTLLAKVVIAGAEELARSFGCVGIRVDAKPDSIAFYARYGFVTLDSEVSSITTPMFLTMEKVRAAMESDS